MTTDAALLLGPGEGERPRDGEFTIKCGREELVLSEADHEPGRREPGPHIHHHHSDAFWMLDGELAVLVGDEEHLLGPGDFVFAPPGLVHTYRSPGSERCRFLNLHAPGMGLDERLRGRLDDFDQHPPPEDGGRPASDGILRRRGEGERIDLGEPARGLLKAGADDGLGSVAVVEFELAPGSPGPPPHRHERLTDSFYVLDGTLTVLLGEERQEAPRGSYALVPPGNVHTVSNPGDRPARFLNLTAPGGLERYLRELAADPADFAAIAARHDVLPA